MQQTPKPEWHWPHFDKPLCGDVSDRDRLGLPEHYVVGRFDESLPLAYERIRHKNREGLLNVVNDRQSDLVERIAAGNLLALIGDPRLSTDNPSMIDIAAGKVEVGLPFEEIEKVLMQFRGLGLEAKWIEKECPRYTVQLAPYRIALYPVTNQEYRTFLLDTGYSELPSSWAFRRYPDERANHPVYTVSVKAAMDYAEWLAKRTGRGFRLPSEAEWEFAAAGRDGVEFPWGNEFNADLCNTAETGLFNTTSVGVFAGGESPYGVSDMAGNVEEYIADQYTPYPDGNLVSDHLTEIHGDYYVARGGSFARFRDLARTRRRHGHNPRSVTYAMGFRLAETI